MLVERIWCCPSAKPPSHPRAEGRRVAWVRSLSPVNSILFFLSHSLFAPFYSRTHRAFLRGARLLRLVSLVSIARSFVSRWGC